MEGEMKKGKVIKHNTNIVLFAGSRLRLTDENGQLIIDEDGNIKEYMLGSDITIMANNDMRLFEVD